MSDRDSKQTLGGQGGNRNTNRTRIGVLLSPNIANPSANTDSFDWDRFVSEPTQRAFTLTTGYTPYRDPTTTFNGFSLNPDIPADLWNAAAPAAPTPLVPPGPLSDPAGFLAAIEANIDFLRGQMRQAERSGTGLLTETPGRALFGEQATRAVLANQQIEGMIRARDIAQNNPDLLSHWAAQQAAGDEGGAAPAPMGVSGPEPAAAQAFAQTMEELRRIVNQLTAPPQAAAPVPPVVGDDIPDASEFGQLYQEYEDEVQRSIEMSFQRAPDSWQPPWGNT